MSELYYGAVPMRKDPTNMTFEQVVENLQQRPVFVHLEPGDGTRYELVICKWQGSLAVMKLDGRPEPGAVYFVPGPGASMEGLVGYNKWSRKFVYWWLSLLSEALFR